MHSSVYTEKRKGCRIIAVLLSISWVGQEKQFSRGLDKPCSMQSIGIIRSRYTIGTEEEADRKYSSQLSYIDTKFALTKHLRF